MDDDTEIERMLEEKMQEDVQKNEKGKEQIINKNGEKKDKDKDKEKKHKKHHKHHKHKSHKSEKKHERKESRSTRRSRSPNDRRHHSPPPPPPPAPAPPTTLPSGKRRDVNSELHQLAKTLSRQTHPKENPSTSKTNRREKSPELTPEERDLRTVFCKRKFLFEKNIYRFY